MKIYNIKIAGVLLTLLLSVFSCRDLSEVNENPNGVDPETVNPNLILTTVLTETGKKVVDLGFGEIAGVVQHTQKDAWFSGHNDYDWASQSWSDYYSILVDNQKVYDKSVELGLEFQQGVTLVMRAYLFGLITDLWGDAPYTNAIQGDLGGSDYLLPSYNSQSEIYPGIIADLEQANTLLSKNKDDYDQIYSDGDVIYNGDPAKWRKLANSLKLRYYMRLAEKDPGMAKSGVEGILANPGQYPIILSSDDDAVMDYLDDKNSNSWPGNTELSDPSGSGYRRIKMCATLVEAMQAKDDPRLGLWAKKVEIPLNVDASLPAGTDEIIDGVRYLSPDVVGDELVDTDPEYVGLPPSVSALPSAYNLNPTPGQLSYNPHVSYLNEIYTEPSGDLLKSRLMSAAEVNFILAEAAQMGWSTGDAKTNYENAVRASFEAWGIPDDYDAYIAGEAAFDGTIEQIIEQKWIASWTAAAEAWFDYRRTGFPELEAGPAANRSALPVRFYYMQDELTINETNAMEAVNKLEETAYTQADGKNSAWAKSWLLQGTNKPW
ncbi:SusD/RagB family nutrient-binding outer membrane lipoprotein [Flexithrix dorotheae]|uniref:SusD/RagB family nutrient-binding outer membrane lipoprotein n=1 Tax=Flexithrix dorotheae TaxID=70993 RepID=UPI00036269F8|nr:SusD/RagB family nutrient-binding outer membrane lipoprotein [Flexithrix dorotheae]